MFMVCDQGLRLLVYFCVGAMDLAAISLRSINDDRMEEATSVGDFKYNCNRSLDGVGLNL